MYSYEKDYFNPMKKTLCNPILQFVTVNSMVGLHRFKKLNNDENTIQAAITGTAIIIEAWIQSKVAYEAGVSILYLQDTKTC